MATAPILDIERVSNKRGSYGWLDEFDLQWVSLLRPLHSRDGAVDRGIDGAVSRCLDP